MHSIFLTYDLDEIGLISSSAREKYLTVECVDMRDVIDEEQLLFERAGSWEEYYSLVREKIRNVKGGMYVCVCEVFVCV